VDHELTLKEAIMQRITGLAAMAVLVVSGTYAQADSIVDGTFNFVQATNLDYPLPTASFVWDSTTSKWKSFTVHWDGAVFNFATFFPNLQDVALDGRWCGDGPDLPDCFTVPKAGEFGLQLHPGSLAVSPEQPTWTDLRALGYGGYTVKETAATTPATTPATTTTTTTVARKCERALGRSHRNGNVDRDDRDHHQQERDDGHDCGRGRDGPHRKDIMTARTTVPEPGTLGLMILGLFGAGFAGRKRRN